MGIEPIEHTRMGHSRAKIVCDDCGKDDCVPCAYLGNANKKSCENRPNESQARAKAISMGWAYVKNKLRCATCEAKRKANLTVTKQSKTPEPPREPTKQQRIQIFAMLAEVYDLDAGRYNNGDTDDTVADVLGVMPGWVAQIREAEFGPDGGNEDIELMAKTLANMDGLLRGFIDEAEKKLADVTSMRADLDKIKKAVGPRVLRVAGVK